RRRAAARWPHRNLHALTECGQRQHEALQRYSPELVIADRRYLGLGHSEEFRGVELGKAPTLDDVIDLLCKNGLGRQLVDVRKSRTGKNPVCVRIPFFASHVTTPGDISSPAASRHAVNRHSG